MVLGRQMAWPGSLGESSLEARAGSQPSLPARGPHTQKTGQEVGTRASCQGSSGGAGSRLWWPSLPLLLCLHQPVPHWQQLSGL